MKTAARHRITTVALSIGLAAALAPAAQAAFPDGDRPGPATPSSPRPDDRAGVRGPGAAPADTPPPSVIQPGGFDWVDAAVGAGVALGGSVLVGGTFVAIRRHGGRGRLATR